MPYFNIVATTNEDTVVAEYQPAKTRSEGYQSEAALEAEFIRLLGEQGYEYLPIHSEADLINNLRQRLESLNGIQFSDGEWDRFFGSVLANPNDGIIEKTRRLQEDWIQALIRDDGTTKNIRLVDKDNVHNNSLQVINQYEVNKSDGAKYDNRYDVTILLNGFPVVHIELKRRGVAIREAFNQISRYQRDSFWAGCGLYEYVQIFVISNGTSTKYYASTVRQSIVNIANGKAKRNSKDNDTFEFTSYWADGANKPIPDLIDYTKTFFAKHTLLNILTKYCVFTTESKLLVMRPYQITATERILNRIKIATTYKKYGDISGGGYIWHTTGSGKTLTSFKTAQLASKMEGIDKVLFVVDRKDLDYQTMKEYDKFEKGAANGNSSTAVLQRQLENLDDKGNPHEYRIIVTTIQKLSIFINKNRIHPVYNQHVVIIFDECHRSQFGEMHSAIIRHFKKYHIFGFTGTPIFALNHESGSSAKALTTAQTFGDLLHSYTIIDAIRDNNVLPFSVDYIKTMESKDNIQDEEVWDIDRQQALMAPERISNITSYILEHFDRKTYRNKYSPSGTSNGFNSILAVGSISMAMAYYDEFKKQMQSSDRKLKVAIIYSFAANEGEQDGILEEENLESTSGLTQSSRDFLESAIQDYNAMFATNFDTSGERFQNYYKDLSMRMKSREIDLLIVVNMFLTGFDAKTLNTLWVDKNLKMHGLIQAFSRTNRILNSVKTHGNIVVFRNLQKEVNEAISLFGDKDAGGIVLLRSFTDYYAGYMDSNGEYHPGYTDMITALLFSFPLTNPTFESEQKEKEFIALFGKILKRRNLLESFDAFAGQEILTAREYQDYMGWYQDTRDNWIFHHKSGESATILDDVEFEIELIRQVEINIDYILMLVRQHKGEHKSNKDILDSVTSAINASPELRSKRALIEQFIASLNDGDDVVSAWQKYIDKMKEGRLAEIIKTENLKETETRRFIENAFRDGEMKTIGTNIDNLLPPISRFGSSRRADKKRIVTEKLLAYFEMFRAL